MKIVYLFFFNAVIFFAPVVFAQNTGNNSQSGRWYNVIDSIAHSNRKDIELVVGAGFVASGDYSTSLEAYLNSKNYEDVKAFGLWIKFNAGLSFKITDRLQVSPNFNFMFSTVKLKYVYTYLNDYAETKTRINTIVSYGISGNYTLFEWGQHSIYSGAGISSFTTGADDELDGFEFEPNGPMMNINFGYRYLKANGSSMYFEIAYTSIPVKAGTYSYSYSYSSHSDIAERNFGGFTFNYSYNLALFNFK
jgi:hypothetical protein